MQRTTQRDWQHYNKSIDFFELFEAGTFDEEAYTARGRRWEGMVRNEDGTMAVQAYFMHDRKDGVVLDSGWGWYE